MIKRILLFLFGFFVVFFSVAEASELTAIKGTRIVITPPSNFAIAENFQGFLLVEKNASIMVTEFPASFSEIEDAFTKEKLASRNMTLLSREEAVFGGYKGFIVGVSQNAYGAEFRKWIAVTGESDYSVMLVATFPLSFEKELSETMKASLLSVRISEKKSVENMEGMPFAVEEALPLMKARRMGNTLIFTYKGDFPAKSEADPVIIAGASVTSGLVIENRKEFSENRLLNIEELADITILSTTEVNIGNLPGYEILATGINTKKGFRTFIYQVILFKETDYFIIQGFVEAAKKDTYLPLFRKISGSFKRVMSK